MASQKFLPVGGLDVDSDELYLIESKAAFLKNLTFQVSDNNTAAVGQGNNASIFTPLESNSRLCNLTLPAGRNFVCGYGESKELNEGYTCVWNSNRDHLIYRIRGNNGQCEVVYKDACLNFQLDPAHFIATGRMEIKVQPYFNKFTNQADRHIFLIITDDFNDVRYISVEDSVATDSFSPVTFPYFDVNDDTCDRCNWINLGLRTPMFCPIVEPVAADPDDDQPNLMDKEGFQFRVREIDRWGRPSEYGVISTRYFAATGSGCVVSSDGLPRCVNITFKAGCPLTEKIEILFRKCVGKVSGYAVESDWSLYDTLNKYDDCDTVPWYERSINPDLTFDYDTNQITYLFCNNKDCTPVDVKATNRNENPIPITSRTIAKNGKGILLAGNKRRYPPLDCNILEKFDFPVTPPGSQDNCSNQNVLRKITVYAIVWNPFEEQLTTLKLKNGTPVFAYPDCSNNNAFTFKQTLPKGQEGFIGYLAGTKNYAISKQYRYDRTTLALEYTGLNYSIPFGISLNYIAIQKWEFEVPAGKYVFRIAGHRSSPTEDYQKTSTYFIGTTALSNVGSLVQETSEIIIDVCSADYDDIASRNNPCMIYDLTRIGKGCAVADATNLVEGYIREDEKNKYPIERAFVEPSKSDAFYRHYTDHNGHYFAAYRGKGLYVRLRGQKACVNNEELAVSDTSYDNSSTWYRYNELYAYKGLNLYPVRDHYLIKGQIVLCGNTAIGVAGVLVVHKRGGYALTDSDGNFTIVAHANGDTGTRTDDIIYSQRGTCQISSCDNDCNACFTDVSVTALACTAFERIVTVADLVVKVRGLNKRGPTMGGRYGMGLKAFDWMGRETFVQTLDRFFVDIPSLQQTQLFDYSTIGYTIDSTIQLPSWVKYISFYITENLNFDDFLSWVAERVQFVDNTGKNNTAAPTQIRLYYESLAEYNKQYNYSTNATWGIITDEQALITGDEIEIVANGDGTIFNTRITGLAKYDKEGKYFMIDYDDRLKDLKDGALIRFIRPKQCQTEPFYYELCPIIPVINGVPTVLSGTFNYFDSYMQTRQIPVPVATSTTAEDGTITTTTENQLRNFPFLFEHHSPSDFWGNHCITKGRVNVKNPYENQLILPMEIATSAVLSDNYNGLHYFADDQRFDIDENGMVGIVAVFPSGSNYLVICERGNFIIAYDDTRIRSKTDGTVYTPTLENRFGKPDFVQGSEYGCHIEDVNTLCRSGNIVMYIDRNKLGWIQHTFGQAVEVSVAGVKSWLSSKIKSVLAFNANGSNSKKYFHQAIDPKTKGAILSVFTINPTGNADADFVNQERELVLSKHETIEFYTTVYEGRVVNGFRMYSFTPEYYGTLEGDNKDAQLISFRRGEAFIHHQINQPNNDYLNFYGTQCEWVLEVVANLDNTKVKIFQSIEAYVKEIKLYADRIITESGQQSRLMPNWWKRADRFWSGDFKCDILSQVDANFASQTGANVLLDGDTLYGRWLKVRLVPHPNFRNIYFEATGTIIFMGGSEKSSDK